MKALIVLIGEWDWPPMNEEQRKVVPPTPISRKIVSAQYTVLSRC